MALADFSTSLQASIVGSLQRTIDAFEGKIPVKVLNNLTRSGLSLVGNLIIRAESDMSFTEEDLDSITDSYFTSLFSSVANDSIDLLNPRDGSKTTSSFSALAPSGYAARYKDKSGRPISALNLVRLINAALAKYMRLVMNPGGMIENTLTNRTGRFANSATVSSITPSKTTFDPSIGASRGSTSFTFKYLVAPYSVFDPSVSSYKNLSSPTRNPRVIIAQAIQEALHDTLHNDVFQYEIFKFKSGGSI